MSDHRKILPDRKPARGKHAAKPSELLNDHEVAEALRAIKTLQSRRRNALDRSTDLVSLAYTAVTPGHGRPGILNRLAGRTGKTWKALKEFPGRLEGVAVEVERVNKGDNTFYLWQANEDLSRAEFQRLEQISVQLPAMIRDYAKALRERNAVVATSIPRHGRPEAVLGLSKLVKFLTGAFHDREVAQLLNAVAGALSQSRRFDAAGITQLRSRRSKH